MLGRRMYAQVAVIRHKATCGITNSNQRELVKNRFAGRLLRRYLKNSPKLNKMQRVQDLRFRFNVDRICWKSGSLQMNRCDFD